MTLAERMYNLGTETAFEVLAKARALEAQGREIIHLEIGEPDFDTPKHIVDAGVRALQEGYTHYGPTPGLPELREAVARNSREVRGIDTDPGQVVVTPGAKPIMFYVILALAEPGAEVIYPNPGFPHLRVNDPLFGRHPGAHAVAGGEGLSPRPGRLGRQDYRSYPADHR